MRYIYYIAVIMLVFSGLAVYGLVDTRIEISEPFISINDRIISKTEFEKMTRRKPAYMTREQFIESVIDQQLMIQEAIQMDIHKEESFRESVENFYEQSLIKILLDRKMDALIVDVTEDEIEQYRELTGYRLFLTKFIYPGMKDAINKANGTAKKITADFTALPDDLKFTVLTLEKGAVSQPKDMGMQGVVVYSLDDKKPIQSNGSLQQEAVDARHIQDFLQNMKKEQLLDEWTRNIRQSADIWRKE
ncbi:MAG TPA: hypothetical protein VJ943_02765 [Desulfotignum sp.]|nr:hypothetical protein [Desulfotignum sp.]